MKKIAIISTICLIIVCISNITMAKIVVTNEVEENTQNSVQDAKGLIQEIEPSEKTGELVELKEKEKKSLDYYTERYGSETYGFTAYLLDKVRIYSIPLCFLGVAISAIYQYVIGIRKLDVRDKGFGVMIAIITVFVICQVLPLVFAIVVKGWRG